MRNRKISGISRQQIEARRMRLRCKQLPIQCALACCRQRRQTIHLYKYSESVIYKLPKRFTTTPSEGALRGIDPVQFDIIQKAYYRLLGWDENGVPTRQKLKDLDIIWAAKLKGSAIKWINASYKPWN